MFSFILDVNGAIFSPSGHRVANKGAHVGCDLSLNVRGLEEGSNEAMDSPLQASIDEQNGGFPHQLRQRFRVRRHKRLGVAVQYASAHLCVRRNYGRTPKYMRLKHFPIP